MDLPQPDSPTRPKVSPLSMLERDPIHRLQVRPADPEVLLEVLYLQERLAVRATVLFGHVAPPILAGGSTLGAIWWCSQQAALCSSENRVYSGISSAQIRMA